MKKRIFLILSILSLFLLLLYIFLDVFVLSGFESDYFSIYYSGNYKVVSKEKNNIVLSDDNGGIIQVDGQEADYDLENGDIDELLYSIQDIISSYGYKLISYDDSNFCSESYSCTQYFYKSNKKEMMVVIAVQKKSLVMISYTATSKFFDLNLGDFYEFMSAVEIK